MSSSEYRDMARDCMRMANSATDSKPLWVTLAQSWLRLAEQVDRLGDKETNEAAVEKHLVPN